MGGFEAAAEGPWGTVRVMHRFIWDQPHPSCDKQQAVDKGETTLMNNT